MDLHSTNPSFHDLYSFASSGEAIPDSLIASLAKLCCAIIVASAVSSPLEADHPLAAEGLKVTQQFLCNCEPVVKPLMQCFKHVIQVAGTDP